MLVDAAVNHERLSGKIAALVASQEDNQRRTILFRRPHTFQGSLIL